MESAPRQSLTITSVKPGDEAAAVRLVFRGLVGEEQLAQTDQLLGTGSPKDLLGAYRGPSLVGAIYCQPQPGKVALVWYPRTVAGEAAETAEQLLVATRDRLHQQGIRIAQCLLRDVRPAEEAVLQKAQFSSLAKLYYLVSLSDSYPASEPASELEFEPYSEAARERLLALIEATYRQTLDCPAMNGMRPTDEVLDGYRASGVFDPERWLLITHRQQDVGCLLLTDYPEQENWELIYMGVRPEFRGRGWGLAITRQAQWRAARAGRPRLVLAVDAENGPALRMYSAAGFRAWDRRRVFVWQSAENRSPAASVSQA